MNPFLKRHFSRTVLTSELVSSREEQPGVLVLSHHHGATFYTTGHKSLDHLQKEKIVMIAVNVIMVHIKLHLLLRCWTPPCHAWPVQPRPWCCSMHSTQTHWEGGRIVGCESREELPWGHWVWNSWQLLEQGREGKVSWPTCRGREPFSDLQMKISRL